MYKLRSASNSQKCFYYGSSDAPNTKSSRKEAQIESIRTSKHSVNNIDIKHDIFKMFLLSFLNYILYIKCINQKYIPFILVLYRVLINCLCRKYIPFMLVLYRVLINCLCRISLCVKMRTEIPKITPRQIKSKCVRRICTNF